MSVVDVLDGEGYGAGETSGCVRRLRAMNIVLVWMRLMRASERGRGDSVRTTWAWRGVEEEVATGVVIQGGAITTTHTIQGEI